MELASDYNKDKTLSYNLNIGSDVLQKYINETKSKLLEKKLKLVGKKERITLEEIQQLTEIYKLIEECEAIQIDSFIELDYFMDLYYFNDMVANALQISTNEVGLFNQYMNYIIVNLDKYIISYKKAVVKILEGAYQSCFIEDIIFYCDKILILELTLNSLKKFQEENYQKKSLEFDYNKHYDNCKIWEKKK